MPIASLTDKLIEWYQEHHRNLPWRNTKDPYAIWLSEIILQQTRVDQGLPYFQRFIDTYPDIHALAEAPEEEVLRLWQGLGYYSRARNLMRTAKLISREMGGVFPTSAQELRKLPGIGPYTAAAIASFAFQERVAVIDGNVLRVISRLYDLNESIDEPGGRRAVEALCNDLILHASPDTFNQAIMELGALVCTPKARCGSCPLSEDCEAFRSGTVKERPVRSKNQKVKTLELHYVLALDDSGRIALRKRPEKGIWANLHEFILAEDLKEGFQVQDQYQITHLLTHRKLIMRFDRIHLPYDELPKGYRWLERRSISEKAFPVPMLKALKFWKLN